MTAQRWLVVLACSLLAAAAAKADEVPVDLGAVTEQHVMIPMRDGKALSAYLFFPPGKGPWPVLYEQRYADIRGVETRKTYGRLAAAGFVVAAENFRGAHLSEGEWVGYRALGWGEKKDGFDTVEWLARQPWSTGKIGTFGGSQAGFAQNFLAVTQPPHLVCQYMTDTGLSLFHEGYRIGGATRPERFKQMESVCRDPEDNRRLLTQWFAHPTYDDYWAEEDCTRHFDKMNVPCFTLGSWYDFMCVGSVESFIGRLHRAGEDSKGKQQLLIGPWLHGGPKGGKIGDLTYPDKDSFDLQAHMIRWFNHYLKGIDNGAERDPTVRYYVMGAVGEKDAPGNVWRTAPDWPEPAKAVPYYLRDEGKLTTLAPDEEKSATTFQADPLHPNEIPAGAFRGAKDARDFEKQAEVRTFTSDVLTDPVEWTGKVQAELYVSSTAKDTDFIVRLSDVYPDGRSILLMDYIRRARYREGYDKEVMMEANKVYKVAFDVGWTSQIFNRRHRIRVTVASTGAPFYEPNPNTGEPLAVVFPKDAVVAKNMVFHNKQYASHILAPIRSAGLPDDDRKQIESGLKELNAQLDRLLVDTGEDCDDAEIFAKGVTWALRYDTQFDANDVALLKKAIDRGKERVAARQADKQPWAGRKGKVVRSFVSIIDGSVQPYGVIVPAKYDPARPIRLDVVLHGSSKPVGMSELRFMSRFDEGDGEAKAPPDVDYIELHPLGRVENGYRWAGETDVFEAIKAVCRNYNIDRDRIVLRGMSMGASGTWHLGLKHPDQFVALGPYCGYVDTHHFSETPLPSFVKVGPLPPYQEKTLHMLDSIDYAANAGVVPAVACIGDKDVFFQAHVLMGQAMEKEGLQMVNLISHGTGHVIDPETMKEEMRRIGEIAAKGLDHTPKKIRFVTWTLKYSRCDWLEVLGMEEQYQRAELEAEIADGGAVNVKEPKNVTRFAIHPPLLQSGQPHLRVGGVDVAVPAREGLPGNRPLVIGRRDGKWTYLGDGGNVDLRGKQPDVQGPIDDAFTRTFLCVRGTGKAWNPAVQAWSDANLKRFSYEWNRYFRGKLPVKDDKDVTEDDAKVYNLILFGDPGSNSVIRRVLPKLPIRWSRDEVQMGKERYAAADHAPVLIQPNPEAPGNYVVLNSGHTFHEKELSSLNYLLFPRLADWAVFKVGDKQPDDPSLPLDETLVKTDFFNEQWQFPEAADASSKVPEALAPFFHPPKELAGDLGDYQSPLKFYDGSPVKTPADWPKRRQEILKTWTDLMGPWPALIEKPKLEYLEKEHLENYTQHHIRIEVAPGWNTDDAYLLVPDGDGPFPAAVVVFYDAKTGVGLGKEPGRDFARQLAKRGFVALSLGSAPGSFFPDKDKAQLQPLSFHAYMAANCHTALANLPQVDPKRIGIVGHSYGGKWAMFASCLYDKFACAVWSDPGIVFDEKRSNVNYWEPWYLGYEPGKERKPGIPDERNPRTGPYKKMIEDGRDLHELHALMAPRPFLVSGGSEDTVERWKALNHSIAVNKFLGFEDRVAMTNRMGHSPTEESNEQLCLFFESVLKPSKKH